MEGTDKISDFLRKPDISKGIKEALNTDTFESEEEEVLLDQTFHKITPVGENVSAIDGIIKGKVFSISELKDDVNDIGGGCEQKILFYKGTAVIGTDEFWVQPGLPLNCLVLSAQIIQVSVFDPTPANITWEAWWYSDAIPIQSIATALVDGVGTIGNRFFDINAASNTFLGIPKIKIKLSANAVNTGMVMGFMHYMELTDMQLP